MYLLNKLSWGVFQLAYHPQHNNPVALQAIARFEIASMVPHRGQVSFAEVATHTGLDEKLLRRLLRHAMTMRVFYEPEPGMISHTKASKLFANSDMNDWLRIGTEEMWPAATKVGIFHSFMVQSS